MGCLTTHVLDTAHGLPAARMIVGVADARANYHVPLLVSPYSISTYRGS